MLKILDYLDDVMYYPILVVVLVLAGLADNVRLTAHQHKVVSHLGHRVI